MMTKNGYCYLHVVYDLVNAGLFGKSTAYLIFRKLGAFPRFQEFLGTLVNVVGDDVRIMLPKKTGSYLHFDNFCLKKAALSDIIKTGLDLVIGADEAEDGRQIGVVSVSRPQAIAVMQHMRSNGLRPEDITRNQIVEFYENGEGRRYMETIVRNGFEDRSTVRRPRVVLKYYKPNDESLSNSEIQGFYGEFDIAFDCSKHHLHAAAANLRRIETEAAMMMVGYAPNKVVTRGGDYMYADVGANYVHNLHRPNVHSCCGLLDVRDMQRREDAVRALGDLAAQGELTLQEVEDITNNRHHHVCYGNALNCKIKADVCFFFHSTYDMSENDLVSILTNKNASKAVVTVHFQDIDSPDVRR